MRAIVVADDSARSLVWAEVPAPTIGPEQVRVRAHATAVNRADLLQRRGLYPVPPGASDILGLEVAGTIAAVSGWRVGDRVCALLEGGGYAEEVAVDASMLIAVPESMSFVDAAALPEVVYTAYLNVVVEPALQPGESVLVHAAASGVGTAAVQLCKALGHTCYATTTGAKLDVVRALGATAVFDRQADDFERAIAEATGKRGVDVILDPVGGSYLEKNVRCLAEGGRLVNIGLLGGTSAQLDIARLLTRRLRIIGSVLRSRSRAEKVAITAGLLRDVWPHVTAGAIRPVVERTFPIAEAGAAHALLGTNATVGKIVLTLDR